MVIGAVLSLQDLPDRHLKRGVAGNGRRRAHAVAVALGLPLPVALALLLHRLAPHAHVETLAVAAELAPVPLTLVDDAVLVLAASVREFLAHRSLEEALASFTTGKGKKKTFRWTMKRRQKRRRNSRLHAWNLGLWI